MTLVNDLASRRGPTVHSGSAVICCGRYRTSGPRRSTGHGRVATARALRRQKSTYRSIVPSDDPDQAWRLYDDAVHHALGGRV
jgi:hypothetical protein